MMIAMGASADGLGEQLKRERLLDIEARLSRYRLIAFGVLGIGLLASGPWTGWWCLIPLAAAAAAFAIADRRLAESDNPERRVAAGWAISPLMIAVSVALTGAAESPAVSWFALPAVTLAARYEGRARLIGTVYLFLLMGLSTAAIKPGAVADQPNLLIFPVVLTIAAIVLSSAVVQSDREHRRSAVIDPLTGLLNRAALAQRVAELEQLTGAATERGRIGLLVADLDHFKGVNDVHGHPEGDAVLHDAAVAIRGALRAFDLVYRLGGEEFLMLLPGADAEDAQRIAERVRRAVEKTSHPGVPITISIGGATDDGRDFEFSHLFKQADAALYRAKEAGRNRVEVARAPAPEAAVAVLRARTPL